ncbi:Hypothetical predicted protein [Cloeon dipterum]|uniref:Uncharacterized protein n=1 Tax=Cloeon dipterum TaxID=197152 RepID=A0A8S1E0U4_9INSE|nr:Hypothetical predicted protein [Cloeon dipterum]
MKLSALSHHPFSQLFIVDVSDLVHVCSPFSGGRKINAAMARPKRRFLLLNVPPKESTKQHGSLPRLDRDEPMTTRTEMLTALHK